MAETSQSGQHPPVAVEQCVENLQGRRSAPDEILGPSADEEEYLEFRKKTDWREPYRFVAA